jgi:hypothetical protein
VTQESNNDPLPTKNADADVVDGDGVDVHLALLGSVGDDSNGSYYVDEFNFLNDGAITKFFDAATSRLVPRSWILLDHQSTVDVFCIKHLLKNIRAAPNTCRISCNVGVVLVKMIGDLPGYPAPVWHHPEGIANILSRYRCRVQYDSGEDRAAFHVRPALLSS